MDFIELTIRDFKSVVKRSDIKSPVWFAIEHNLLLHPDFFDITGDELKAYLWILGTAAHLNMPTIRAYPALCCQQINIKKKDFLSSVEKLKGKRWDVGNANESVRICPGNSYTGTATVQYSTVQDSTQHDSTVQGLTKDSHPLIDLWNSNCGKLSVVKKCGDSRLKKVAKLWAEHTVEELTSAIQILAASDFCNGKNDRAWVADFDFFLKPETPSKALEGKYDNRTPKPKLEQIYKNPENVKWALSREGETDEYGRSNQEILASSQRVISGNSEKLDP